MSSFSEDRGDWRCNDQAFKSLEDALAARREGEHVWRDTYIGHSTRGDVCKICNVDYLRGMSVFGCPSERLWDEHWIPSKPGESEKWVKFKEPSKVTVNLIYSDDPWPMNYCIGGNMIVTRDGQVIAEYPVFARPKPELPRVVSIGQRIPVSLIEGEMKTPFLDLLNSKKIPKFKADDYRLRLSPKVEYLPDEI